MGNIFENARDELDRAAKKAKKAAEKAARDAKKAADKAAKDLDRARIKAQKDAAALAEKAARDLRAEVDRGRTAINDIGNGAANDIALAAETAVDGLDRSITKASEDFGRELTWVKEDLDTEAMVLKNKCDKEATHLKSNIDDAATKAKKRIDNEITRSKGKLDGEATKLKARIDREAANAKADIDREISDIKSDIDRELTRLKSDVEREVSQARDDINEAVDAAVIFMESQAQSVGDTLSEAEALAREGKIADALWHVATEPYHDTKEGFIKAVSSSTLLNMAAATAVSVFGSPAAAAAYSAWLTYEMTGDFDAALKAGVIAGVAAQAGKGVDKIDVSTMSGVLKKSIMRGTVNAGAVAASGGSRKDIESAFIVSGTAVAQKDGMALMTKWVQTEVAPYFSDISQPDFDDLTPPTMVERAKDLVTTVSYYKTQFEEAVDVGVQLKYVIENAAEKSAQ